VKKLLTALIIITLFPVALSLNPLLAQEEKLAISTEEATILFLEGSVKVRSLKINRWANAAVDMVLSRGDKLKTGGNSWAEIGFGKDFVNIIRVKENTLVELIDLGPIEIGLLKGEIRSLVESLSRDTTFEIRTPTAICGARGTGWDTNTDGKKVIVDAYEDEVYFKRITKKGVIEEPSVRAGKRGILEDPTKPLKIRNLPISRIKNWDRWKDNFEERKELRKDITKERKKGPVGQPQVQRPLLRKIEDKVEKIENTERIKEIVEKRVEAASERKDRNWLRRRITRFLRKRRLSR